MSEHVLENNKKTSDSNQCNDCGSGTLVWKDNWKVCSNCNAVYGKREVITDINIDSIKENEAVITEDETVITEPSNSYYSKHKGLMLLIPLFFLGAFLYTTI